MHVHEFAIDYQDVSISSDEVPTEVEFDLTSEEYYFLIRTDGVFGCASCQVDSDFCVMNGKDHIRYKQFGCPCKLKQLRALSHSISLISSKKTRQIIGATGCVLNLQSE